MAGDGGEEEHPPALTRLLSSRGELCARLAALEAENVQLRKRLQAASREARGKGGGEEEAAGDARDEGKEAEREVRFCAAPHPAVVAPPLTLLPVPATHAQRQRVLVSLLSGGSFLSASSVAQRASLASLLRQQSEVVRHLAALPDRERLELGRKVRQRFVAGGGDGSTMRQAGHVDEEDLPGVRVRSSLSDAKVAVEWSTLFEEAGGAAAKSTTMGSCSSNRSAAAAAAALDVVVDSLERNREAYSAAARRGTSARAGPDALGNFGFSEGELPGFEYEYDEADSDQNMVEAIDSTTGQLLIKCATLNKLVERMTTEQLHVRYTFLLTYRSFTTPRELLSRLESRYFMPVPPNMTPPELDSFLTQQLAPVQIKVFGVLKKWVEEHYDDFYGDEELTSALKSTLNRMLKAPSGPWAESSARALLALLARKEQGEHITVEKDARAPKSKIPAGMTLAKFSLLGCHPAEIARQLCLLDFAVFRKMKPRELLNKAWASDHKRSSAPHVGAMIRRFNEVCSWTQWEILTQPDEQGRVQMATKMLKVAKHCRLMNNFHSLFAIYSGLNANPVHRLASMWEALDKKQRARFGTFRELFRPEKNSINFRTVMKHALTPCIPHMGLFLQDLTFIEDGNPDKLRDMINFNKRRMLAERILWMKQYQQTSYTYHAVPVIHEYLKRHMVMRDEEEMWQLSCKVEPRKARVVVAEGG